MRLVFLSTVSVLALTLMAPAAYAGFEFVPSTAPVAASNVTPVQPPQVDKSPVAPAVPVVANPNVQSESLTTPVVSGDVGSKAVPLLPVVKNSDALVTDDAAPPTTLAPVAMPAPAPKNSDVLWDSGIRSTKKPEPKPAPVIADTTAASTITQSDLNDGPAIQGFGRQEPLALALQQIVPPNYRYSFDDSTDAGQRVSWTGGKPWKAVITELASKNNMSVDIVGDVIAFHHRSPMEVVSAQSGVDTTPDTVQGMALKPVTTDMTVLPPVVASTSVPSPVAGSDKPMSLLEPYKPDAVSEAMPARQPLASMNEMGVSDLPPPVAAAADKKTTKASPGFDAMLDNNDKPAGTVVADKKIIVADEDDLKPLADTKADAKTATAAPLNITPPAIAAAPKKADTFNNIIFDETPSFNAPQDTADTMAKKLDAAKKADGITAPVVKTDKIDQTNLPALEALKSPLPEVASALPSAATSPSMPAPAADINAVQEWNGAREATLRQVLTDWSQRVGVSLVWSSEYDYPLQTDVRIRSSFDDAVRTILAGFAKAQPRPLGRFFKNKSVGGQPVLVIETQRLTD